MKTKIGVIHTAEHVSNIAYLVTTFRTIIGIKPPPLADFKSIYSSVALSYDIQRLLMAGHVAQVR